MVIQNINNQEKVQQNGLKQEKLIRDFEEIRNFAELKALSNLSLENPLSDKQFKRIMELKNKCLNIELKGGLKNDN